MTIRNGLMQIISVDDEFGLLLFECCYCLSEYNPYMYLWNEHVTVRARSECSPYLEYVQH